MVSRSQDIDSDQVHARCGLATTREQVIADSLHFFKLVANFSIEKKYESMQTHTFMSHIRSWLCNKKVKKFIGRTTIWRKKVHVSRQ